MQTQGAIGNLINRYRAVLNKCRLLNVFGSLAVAGLLVMGGAGVAGAGNIDADPAKGTTYTGEFLTIIADNIKFDNITVENAVNAAASNDRATYIGPTVSSFTIDGGSFTGNSAVGKGGAMLTVEGNTTGKTLVINGTSYSGNSVSNASGSAYGGAIDVRGFDTTITGATFSGNSVSGSAESLGGAIATDGGSLVIDKTKFIGNTQTGSVNSGGGGAIHSDISTALLEITNSEFDGNKAISTSGNESGFGGAIKFDGKELIIDKTVFKNNEALCGGAISTTAAASPKISISNSTFENNAATYQDGENESSGGALLIAGSDLTFSGENVFSGNTSNGKGNDIYTNSDITVADGTTDLQSGYFQQEIWGSTPALTVSDGAQMATVDMILDGGSVTVAGDTNGDGVGGGALGNGTDIAGLQAALAEAKANGVDTTQGAYVGMKPLDLANAALTVGTSTSATAANGQPVFGDGSALVADQTALNGAAAFTGVSTANLADTAQVHVQNAVAGQSLTLFDDNAVAGDENKASVKLTDSTGAASTKSIQITSDDSMVTFGTISNGATAEDIAAAMTGKLGNASNALPGVDGELGALFAGMYAAGLNDTDAAEGGRRFLSRLNSNRFLGGGEAATATIESAARVAAVAGVPQMTWAAQKAANAAVTQRTSLAAPASAGLQAVAADGSVQTGASAGDAMKNGFAMWIMPLYQSWNAWGMEGGNLDMDVNGALGGLAVGADYTFAHAFRAGITVNMGGGYAEGSGDFNKTTNDFTFWGLGAYLGWSKDNFGLTADINHTWVYNDVEQDLSASMRMDTLKSDITSRALSAGLRGEYKLEMDALDITPHVGVRYTYLTTDNYDVESGNGTVLEGDTIHQGIWTFPIGVAFSKDVQMDSGWYVKPSLDVAVVPAAGDIKARGDVRFTGVPGSAEVSSQTMDYITYMGQAGLEFGNDNVKLGVNYNLQMGAQSTAHGVFGTLRYEF